MMIWRPYSGTNLVESPNDESHEDMSMDEASIAFATVDAADPIELD